MLKSWRKWEYPVHILTRLWSRQPRVRLPGRQRNFSLLQNVRVGLIQIAKALIPRGESGRGTKLIFHLHLQPKLRMDGVIPLLRLWTFVAVASKILPLLLPLTVDLAVVLISITSTVHFHIYKMPSLGPILAHMRALTYLYRLPFQSPSPPPQSTIKFPKLSLPECFSINLLKPSGNFTYHQV
jgi:hypothetical protein